MGQCCKGGVGETKIGRVSERQTDNGTCVLQTKCEFTIETAHDMGELSRGNAKIIIREE